MSLQTHAHYRSRRTGVEPVSERPYAACACGVTRTQRDRNESRRAATPLPLPFVSAPELMPKFPKVAAEVHGTADVVGTDPSAPLY